MKKQGIVSHLFNRFVKDTQTKPAPAPKKAAAGARTYRVTGMKYYQTAIMKMAVEDPTYDLSKRDLVKRGLVGRYVRRYKFCPCKVELVPEPDNKKDPNAIKVVVDGAHIGYIKAGSCAHLHKVIREGRLGAIGCEIGGGPSKCVREEVDDNTGKPVYVMETDNSDYFYCNLSIVEK